MWITINLNGFDLTPITLTTATITMLSHKMTRTHPVTTNWFYYLTRHKALSTTVTNNLILYFFITCCIRSTQCPPAKLIIRHIHSCVNDLFHKTHLTARVHALKLYNRINSVQERNSNKTKYFCFNNYFGNMLPVDVRQHTQLPD